MNPAAMNPHPGLEMQFDGSGELPTSVPPSFTLLVGRVADAVTPWTLTADEETITEGAPVVCPFCGSSYQESRRQCEECGSLPVVQLENQRVYDAVLAPCGSSCGRVDG